MPTRVAVAEDVAAECGGEQVDNFVGAADRVQQPAGFGPAGILALLALLALPPTGRDAECLAERLAVQPPDVCSTLALATGRPTWRQTVRQNISLATYSGYSPVSGLITCVLGRPASGQAQRPPLSSWTRASLWRCPGSVKRIRRSSSGPASPGGGRFTRSASSSSLSQATAT